MFHGNRFLSGSVDGLINVFDLSNGFDEDEGFLVSWMPNQQDHCCVSLLAVSFLL